MDQHFISCRIRDSRRRAAPLPGSFIAASAARTPAGCTPDAFQNSALLESFRLTAFSGRFSFPKLSFPKVGSLWASFGDTHAARPMGRT
jgi:hypothetical protein